MSWFPPFCIADNGQVQATTTGTASSFIGAQGFVGVNPLVTTNAPTSVDKYSNGLRYHYNGALFVHDSTLGLPSTTYADGGMRVTPTGQLCITTGAVDESNKVYSQGVAVTNDGRVYMDITP